MVWRRWALRHSQAAGQPQILAVYMRAAWDLWWPGQGAADPALCRTAETPAIASGTFHGQNLIQNFQWKFLTFPMFSTSWAWHRNSGLLPDQFSAKLSMLGNVCQESKVPSQAKASALRSWTNMQRRLQELRSNSDEQFFWSSDSVLVSSLARHRNAVCAFHHIITAACMQWMIRRTNMVPCSPGNCPAPTIWFNYSSLGTCPAGGWRKRQDDKKAAWWNDRDRTWNVNGGYCANSKPFLEIMTFPVASLLYIGFMNQSCWVESYPSLVPRLVQILLRTVLKYGLVA